MSLVEEYLELTKKYSEEYGDLTIILMQNGAFFEVYALKDGQQNYFGCQINEFSVICDLNIVDKKVPGGGDLIVNGNPVVNAGFKTHLVEKYIKKLQDNGYTIVVYEEVGDDPVKNRKLRQQTGIYSPGTYFYSEQDNEQITNNICCLWIETKKGALKTKHKTFIYIGLAIIDIYTGKTTINEYNDEYVKNPTTFDDVERFMSIYNPSETIIISNLSNSDINDVVSFINLKSRAIHIVDLLENRSNKNTQRALNCEKQKYQTELINKFYQVDDIQTFMLMFYENVYATQAFCFLLDFVFQHNPYLIKNIKEPIFESNNNKLILANHSLKQLNIIDDDNYKGKYSSVSRMLNECMTSMGKRKFKDLFLNPVNDIDYLNTEYNTISDILSNNYDDDYATLKMWLVKIKDICKIMRQIVLEKVSPKMLYQLYNTTQLSRLMYNYVSKNNALSQRLSPFVSLIDSSNKLITFLEEMFLIEECQTIDNLNKIDKSFIKNGVDADLDYKIQTLMESQDQLEACRAYFSSLIGTNGKSFVNIHETEKNNFTLCATDLRCKALVESIKELGSKHVILKYKSTYSGLQCSFQLSLELEYIKQTATNKSITNEQINSLCKNVTTIKQTLIDTVSKVYQTIIKNMLVFQTDIDLISNFITFVDVAYCKATIATKYNYCRPVIERSDSGNSYVRTTDLRHCLIEKLQQTELYVGNDINIGDYAPGKEDVLNGMLLYGTNAVGKTSFIRSLGVAVIMAQAGMYVPATTFVYMPYKYVFTRIIGNDNIFKGLSTFAVEMSELRTILRFADKNSLVLGDELCSGTESISAVSIFVAGIQKLSAVDCSFIFATHLHEIISYDEINIASVRMKHMSVVYDKERDCLVYDRKLTNGPGNNMYGLEVCKSLNLPADFLENANAIRMKYHPETSSILDSKGSHYNARHIAGGLCEMCNKNVAIDVHHLAFQKDSDENGVIKMDGLVFGKNDKANLANLCKQCHDIVHEKNVKMKRTKTTKGYVLK